MPCLQSCPSKGLDASGCALPALHVGADPTWLSMSTLKNLTEGNSWASWSYTGAIILQGPHLQGVQAEQAELKLAASAHDEREQQRAAWQPCCVCAPARCLFACNGVHEHALETTERPIRARAPHSSEINDGTPLARCQLLECSLVFSI